MLQISSELLDRIVAESVANPFEEVCGLLFGGGGAVTAIGPCRNVAADPARRFEIDPAALLGAHRRARAGGPAVIGCYHSHPGGSAVPSPRDADHAVPDGSVWLIVAGREVRAWRAVERGDLHDRFTSVGLRVTAGNGRGPR